MKRKQMISALLSASVLMVGAAHASVASSSLPAYRPMKEQTVTISRSEYDELLKFQKQAMLLELAQYYYYEDIDEEEMLDTAAVGLMAGIGDIYSMYYPKEEMDAFNEETEGEYAGIGCQLLADSTDKLITVTRVFKGSPAEFAGIREGDKIVYVNDIYYSAYEMDEAVSVMRGEPGEAVKVTVMRDLETLDFDIVRQKVNINYVEYEILDGQIGYVMIYDFLGDSLEGFKEVIDVFKAADVKGMIIDLRNNGGGLVDDAVGMADLILPEGVVVSMRDKYDQVEEFPIDNEYYSVPMAVLINGYSASASEILSGAIRDYGAGTLIGEKSFGKGIVQSVLEFPDGSGVKLTTARYYTPSGECIHGIGITPDIEVALDDSAVTRYGINNLPHEQDAQLQMAIAVLTDPEKAAAMQEAAVDDGALEE